MYIVFLQYRYTLDMRTLGSRRDGTEHIEHMWYMLLIHHHASTVIIT